MKRYLILCVFCISFQILSSQNSTEEEQYEKSLQIAQDRLYNQLDILSKVEPIGHQNLNTSRSFDDADDDGVDDNWELMNGMDPNNPKDAWEDFDADKILNLFEFQLDADPNDELNPTVINFDPINDDLDSFADAADGESRLIRIPEGIHNVNVLSFYKNDTRVMFQGGWNSDFTVYDPELYSTVLDGRNLDETLYLSTSSAADDIILHVIVDGLHIINGLGTFGNLNLIGSTRNSFSIHDCKIYGGTNEGISLRHWGGEAYVSISKVEISNNGNEAISNQTIDSCNAKWRLSNITVADNVDGINGFANGATSILDVKIVNNNFRNNSTDVSLRGNVDIDIFNTNIETYPNENQVFSIDLGDNIDEDPLFVSAEQRDYRLLATSPCIDKGIKIGLHYGGLSPEMGAYEFDAVSTLDNEILGHFNIYPNPTLSESTINFEGGWENELHLKSIELRDFSGALLKTWNTNFSHSFGINLPELSVGIYFLQIFSPDGKVKKHRIQIVD